MLKALTVAMVIGGLSAPLAAQSVYGSGGKPCSNWTANLRSKWARLGDTDWLMGYVSGVNRARGPGSRMMANANVQAATGFVTDFCAANPQRPIFEAADALILQLEAAPPPLPPV
jgi:hypothetical protein